ncbi:MAG: hypothetical protein KatS3mg121_0722 [Gammaproteobacteria bacterium]|nr:MAG: hypothetical protein KatS3mg121_0722 [Gammaproteobacteria bacterium]
MNDTPAADGRSDDHNLCRSVERCLAHYFAQLDGDAPADLYRLVIHETERALLGVVMQRTAGNQSKAAAYLGITRSTLRKKLRQHGFDGRGG